MPKQRPIASPRPGGKRFPPHQRWVPVTMVDSRQEADGCWSFFVELQGRRMVALAVEGFLRSGWIMGDLVRVRLDRLSDKRFVIVEWKASQKEPN